MSTELLEILKQCTVKICQDPDCAHPEDAHLYSPPGYSSSDGLPTFDGCNGDGYTVDPGEPDDSIPEENCKCWGFEDPDAVEPEEQT